MRKSTFWTSGGRLAVFFTVLIAAVVFQEGSVFESRMFVYVAHMHSIRKKEIL